MNLLSTGEAGERLGISAKRVFQLIQTGRLPAIKVGRNYAIDAGDLKLVKNRKPGRPRKRVAPKTRSKRVRS